LAGEPIESLSSLFPLPEMFFRLIHRAQTIGFALLILSVSLLPYRYLTFDPLPTLFIQFLPLWIILSLSVLMLVRRSAIASFAKEDPLLAPIIAVLVVDLLSAIGGMSAFVSLQKIIYYFFTGPFLYFLIRWMETEFKKSKVSLLLIISASSTLAAIYGISEFWAGENWLFGEFLTLDNFHYSAMVGQAVFVNRIMGTVGHPVAFAAYLLLCLPASGFFIYQDRITCRWFGIISSALIASSIFFTLSRGAWGGLLAAALFYSVSRNRRLLIIVLMGLGILGGLVSQSGKLSALVRSRNTYSQYVQNFSTDPRIKAYSHVAQGLPLDILLGSGTGNYHVIAGPLGSKLNTPDNMFLMRLAETGLIGMITWIFLFQRITAVLIKNSRTENEFSPNPTMGFSPLLLAGFIGFSLDMATFDALYFPVTRIMFWILVGIGCSSVSLENTKRAVG
jgi:hypothetical protein